MHKYQEIKCRKLDRTMTAGKCLRLQEEAEGFYGKEKASRCGSCPCEQGLEIRREIEMAQNKRRECRNCKRVMVIAQDGLCGGCWCRTKGLSGKEKDEALAKAKADFGGVPEGERAPQRKFFRGPKVKPEAAPDSMAEVGSMLTERGFLELLKDASAKHPGLIEKPPMAFEALPADHPAANMPLLSIIVNFTDGDGPLFDGLMALGKKYRRSPDQQILWLLEKELNNEGILSISPLNLETS